MPSDTKRILLTGATGYIGGSVLAALLDSADPVLQSAPITCLLCGVDRAVTLSFTYGDRVKPILCRDLDDVETATTIAAQHDIVVHCTLGYHPASALALVRGLTQRRAAAGREVWIIHTSGTSKCKTIPSHT
jgi:nucleoside-diphosphate-sugar epimerase